MTRREFAAAVRLADDCSTFEEYLRKSAPNWDGVSLRKIWELMHCNFREIRAHTGLSQAEFSARYLMSKRAIESWEAGAREVPIYLRVLIAEVTGYLNLDLE